MAFKKVLRCQTSNDDGNRLRGLMISLPKMQTFIPATQLSRIRWRNTSSTSHKLARWCITWYKSANITQIAVVVVETVVVWSILEQWNNSSSLSNNVFAKTWQPNSSIVQEKYSIIDIQTWLKIRPDGVTVTHRRTDQSTTTQLARQMNLTCYSGMLSTCSYICSKKIWRISK